MECNSINPMDHAGLVYYWCHRFRVKLPIEDSEEYADAWIGLLRAAKSYNPDLINPETQKSYSFSGYASEAIKREIWKQRLLKKALCRGGSGYRKQAEAIATVQMSVIDGSISRHNIYYNECPSMEYLTLDHRMSHRDVDGQDAWVPLLEVLSDREKEMVDKVIMQDYYGQDLATVYGISRQRVDQILKRALYKMRKKAQTLR